MRSKTQEDGKKKNGKKKNRLFFVCGVSRVGLAAALSRAALTFPSHMPTGNIMFQESFSLFLPSASKEEEQREQTSG